MHCNCPTKLCFQPRLQPSGKERSYPPRPLPLPQSHTEQSKMLKQHKETKPIFNIYERLIIFYRRKTR